MKRDEFRKLAVEWAERTPTEQGLPAKVMDIEVLRKVAQLLGLLQPERSNSE